MTDLKLSAEIQEGLKKSFQGKGEVNYYVCKLNSAHKILTVDLDTGTTPFSLSCAGKGAPECESYMQSAMYPGWPVPDGLRTLPLFIWYRPSQEEYEGLSPAMKEYVKMGGLEIRPAHADEKIDISDGRFYVRGIKQ